MRNARPCSGVQRFSFAGSEVGGEDALVKIPETKYAVTPDGVYLAYQVVGEGPVDLVWQFDIFGNVDLVWETALADWYGEFASFCRLILHDRRGTGLSTRNVPPPDLETRVADLSTILDAAGSARAVLGGVFDAAAPNVMFAGSQPERVHSLVWWEPQPRNTWAPDYPWGVDNEYLERSRKVTAEFWGSAAFGAAFVEVEATVGHEMPSDAAAAFSRLARHTVTPEVAVALDLMWEETDVRAILPSVTAPALLLASGDMGPAEYVASVMPHAEIRTLSKDPGLVDPMVITAIREWIGAPPMVPALDRILATVLFTDIVGSTERLTEVGDSGWRSILARHEERARAEIERYRGRYIDSTGDGVFATFDGPARAVRCAQAIGASVRDLGIEIRAGVHTGEVELDGDDVRGIAVHIGARVAALGGASEVLVSQTVKDLTAGSGLTFEDRGEHDLKGVPDPWHLYRVIEDLS
jgi:class 3 adenylate cyclase/pimeloyl-ACP methyl ester carboxylesterase